MPWTEERVEHLKQLWADGISSAEIAVKLGGVSRNAVIGKIYRLGLSNKSNSKRGVAIPESSDPSASVEAESWESAAAEVKNADSEERQDEVDDAADRPTEAETAEHDPESDLANARRAEEASLKLSLMELTERTCKWPIGDPATSEFWFCGLPSSPGKPYCDAHGAIASQPITPRRDRKIQRKPDLISFTRR